MNNYFDEFGRLHHKPVTKDNPIPSNNGWWYSGLYEVITGVRNFPYYALLEHSIVNLETVNIHRHPEKYWSIKNVPPISKDEIFGLNICPDAEIGKPSVYRALKANNWCFGGVKGLPYWHLYWIPLAIFQGIQFKLRKEHRNAVWQKPEKYKWLRQIAFRLMPWDVYYMKRTNNDKYSSFESWTFAYNVKNISENGSKSSKNLVIGQLLHLGKKVVASKYFDIEQCMRDYFPGDHPIVRYFDEQ